MSGFNPMTMPQIDVQTLAERLAEPATQLQLIDVREPQEIAIAAIPGFTVLPLSQYGDWCDRILTDFDPTVETIVMCHLGMRSAQMCQWLYQQGFENVKNLTGGIDAYSVLVDPEIPRY